MSNAKRQIICEDVNTEEKMVYLLPFGSEFDFEGSANKGNVLVIRPFFHISSWSAKYI